MKNDTKQTVPIYGLILAGGRSIRMGHDKSVINYHGKPQREFLFELMKSICSEVYTSCKTAENVPPHLHPLVDQFEIESPLNGVLSAFRFNPSVAWLTAPVDMPNITRESLIYLISHRDSTKLATCYYDSDGKDPEPLFTLWEPQAYSLLNEHYLHGHRGIKPFLLKNNIHLLHAPDSQVHQNINSPEQLEKHRRKLE